MVTYRSEQISSILRKMHKQIENISVSVVVNVNGLLIESYPPGQRASSSDQVAALTATLITLAERTLARLEQGAIERLMLEGDEGIMVVFPSGTQAALAILMAKEAKLGMALYGVKRAADDIAEVLGA